MKQRSAKALLWVSAAAALAAASGPLFKLEPFHTYFFLFAWWPAIVFADSWLYLRAGDSILVDRPVEFVTFLAPFSALLWFLFETWNLRLDNWAYIGVPASLGLRWPGYFLAFATVLPGLFVAANLLEHFGCFRKNEFSRFFAREMSPALRASLTAAGAAMLLLPLAFPGLLFPLVWGGFVPLLDPWNAARGGRSLIQEWRQGNWNRTLQLLLAGLACGGLWELWNFWAGSKWIYTVPLPQALLRDWKIFEMPAFGFLGFPPFALECFVMAEFARNLRARLPRRAWRALSLGGFAFMAAACSWIDAHTVLSFR